MALINYAIPKRNFELVRDAIGGILFTELENQYLNGYNIEADTSVFVERKRPIDQNETSFVNVCLVSNTFGNKNAGSKDGTVQYSVDITTKQASESNVEGDSASQILMTRLLSLCDYILEDPQYRTLGFSPGFISGLLVNEIQVYGQRPEDASNIAMGRLIVTVRINEPNGLLAGRLIQNSTTSYSINQTNLGYQYIST